MTDNSSSDSDDTNKRLLRSDITSEEDKNKLLPATRLSEIRKENIEKKKKQRTL